MEYICFFSVLGIPCISESRGLTNSFVAERLINRQDNLTRDTIQSVVVKPLLHVETFS